MQGADVLPTAQAGSRSPRPAWAPGMDAEGGGEVLALRIRGTGQR